VNLLFDILWTVLLPIFLMIGAGAVLARCFRLDADTMGKLNLYVFTPALVFVKFTESGLAASDMGTIALYWTCLVGVLLAVSAVVCRLAGVRDTDRPTVAIGSAFTNSGNFGIPAAQLAFGAAGAAVQAVILAMENLLFFTLGLLLASGWRSGPRETIRTLARQPVLWAIPAALLLRGHADLIPAPFSVAVSTLGAGLVPLALVTLGTQLVGARHGSSGPALPMIVGIRLVAAPIVGLVLVHLFSIQAPVAGMLVTAAGYPCAVNSVILAIEFKRSPALASASVFWTTLGAAVTVTAVLAAVR